jgi:hypothetical protein
MNFHTERSLKLLSKLIRGIMLHIFKYIRIHCPDQNLLHYFNYNRKSTDLSIKSNPFQCCHLGFQGIASVIFKTMWVTSKNL